MGEEDQLIPIPGYEDNIEDEKGINDIDKGGFKIEMKIPKEYMNDLIRAFGNNFKKLASKYSVFCKMDYAIYLDEDCVQVGLKQWFGQAPAQFDEFQNTINTKLAELKGEVIPHPAP